MNKLQAILYIIAVILLVIASVIRVQTTPVTWVTPIRLALFAAAVALLAFALPVINSI